MAERWDSIKVVSKETDFPHDGAKTGVDYKFTYTLDEAGLNDAVGLELVTIINKDGEEKVDKMYPFKMIAQNDNLYTFEATFSPDKAGTFKMGVRMYPKSKLLPYRQDFAYVKWLE